MKNMLRWFYRSAKASRTIASARRVRPALEVLEDRHVPSTFMVTTTNDSGPGSLRAAIYNADFNPGQDTIDFDIPGPGVHTIQPGFPLPELADPVILDGTSQPGYAGQPLIQLDGTFAGASADGLDITTNNSFVKGLTINRFGRDGVYLTGLGWDVVQGCYIGTDVTGTQPLRNGSAGVQVTSSHNMIGGTTLAARNLIFSDMEGDGVLISSGIANCVEGNYIGTDVTGTRALDPTWNLNRGVRVLSSYNFIGYGAPGAGNVISGNGVGIDIEGAGNSVQGNYIGTNAAGTRTLSNLPSDQGTGVSIIGPGASANLIGGVRAGARNVISGNWNNGVVFEGAGANNQVQGNDIGTDVTGTQPLGNQGVGVCIDDSSQELIGGTTPGAGNIISANLDYGVEIVADLRPPRSSNLNRVQGNWIGTNPGGSPYLGNRDGVYVCYYQPGVPNSYGNQIGGSSAWLSGSWDVQPGAGNVIAYNTGYGVKVFDSFADTPIRGNAIYDNGVNLDQAAAPNFYPMLFFAQSGSTTVVEGAMSSALPDQMYVVDFYATTESPTGAAQVQRYLGSTLLYMVPGEPPVFVVAVGATTKGEWITATVTDYWGNTTDFGLATTAQ
jgi:hypothetical protein